MGRRNKRSPAEDLVDLIALMPWWAGCALALVSYLWLHGVATQGGASTTQIGTMVTHTVFTALAAVGQFLVPLLCLMGA